MKAAKSSLLHRSFNYGIGILLLKGLPILMLPIYTRLLPPDEFGLITVAASLIALLVIVLPAGFNAALSYFYATTSHGPQRPRIAGTLWLCMVLSSIVLLVAFETLGKLWLHPFLGSFPFDPHFRLVLWISVLSVIPLTPTVILQVEGRSLAWTLTSSVNALLVQLGTLATVVFIRADAVSYLSGMLAGSFISAIVFLVITLRLVKPRWDTKLIGQAAIYGGPLLAHSILGFCSSMADRLILANYVPLAALGAYAVAAQLAATLSVVGYAFNTTWLPALLEFSASPHETEAETLARYAKLYLAGMACLTVALLMFAPEILFVLGPAFQTEAASVVAWLVVGILTANLYYLPSSALFAVKRTTAILGCTALSAATSLILNLLLVPRFGISGAAVAFCAANGVLLAFAIKMAPRPFPVPLTWPPLFRLTLAAAAVALLTISFRLAFGEVSWVVRLALALAFPAMLVMAGVVAISDWQVVSKRALTTRRTEA